ncbi:MAG: TolC family protein [Myxococcota bacterium]
MRLPASAAVWVGALIALAASARAQSVPDRAAVAAPSAPLELREVLESVDRFHPLWLAVELERERAEGELLAARGAFDTRLRAGGEGVPQGYYDRYTADLGIEQPTRLWGSRFFGGYRIGRGDFPSYLGGLETNKAGELRAGVEVPLLRGGFTDAARTALRQGEIGRRAAEPRIELARLEIVRDASDSFWSWVAMGLNVEVETRLLVAAQTRQEQLSGRADRGAIPRIQLVDNERLIVDRRIRLRGAERDAQEAAIALSLFLRDERGRTSLPGRERLPSDFPAERLWGAEQMRSDIERARTSHPALRRLALRRSEIEARYELERNGLLPDLRLKLEGSRDLGRSEGGIDTDGSFASDSRDDTEVKASLRLELPVAQRRARGRVLALRAQLRRLDLEARLARDRIEAEVRTAMSDLSAAFDQTVLARKNLDLARELERAEVRKLMLGSSDLIAVNIREIQTADAARALIFAQAAYFRSVARYRAAMAAAGEPHPSDALADGPASPG